MLPLSTRTVCDGPGEPVLQICRDGHSGSASDNKYDNKYHYISVPLSLQWQFAKHFTWENQLTYSRLLSTNALHFDGATGSYYEKRDF